MEKIVFERLNDPMFSSSEITKNEMSMIRGGTTVTNTCCTQTTDPNCNSDNSCTDQYNDAQQ